MKRLLIPALILNAGALLFSQSTISFKDKTSIAGLGGSAHNQGLALADYDGDGREDIYVSVVDGSGNRLYRNLGNLHFEEVASVAGVAYSGASRVSAWGDIDNDGDPDLYVGNRNEADILYINQGDGTFTDETIAMGINNPNNTTSVTMADVNQDGWLDIYVSNIQSPNILYINSGTGSFTNEAAARGVDDLAVGMGAVFFDYDLDGDQDIYQCHDAQIPYILYANDGHGYFSNVAALAQVNYAGFGMGVDVGDFNLDGYPDMYITNLYANTLFQNMGDGTFKNVSAEYTVGDEGMGWGNVFADFDNDRWPDIYVSNDTYFAPYANTLFRNTGTNFEEIAADDDCKSPFGGYATVASDLDDDGRIDILVANSGDPGVQLLQNTSSNENHFVAFHLEGVQSNRDAIGARIDLYTPSGIQYDQVISNSGFGSNNGRWIHFGLGQETSVEKVIVHWPAGLEEEIDDLTADKKYNLREGLGVVTKTVDPHLSLKPCHIIGRANEIVLDGFEVDDNSSFALYDMLGRLILFETGTLHTGQRISMPPLTPGIYHFNIVSGHEVCSGLRFFGSR